MFQLFRILHKLVQYAKIRIIHFIGHELVAVLLVRYSTYSGGEWDFEFPLLKKSLFM